MATHSSILLWSLVGYNPWGHKEYWPNNWACVCSACNVSLRQTATLGLHPEKLAEFWEVVPERVDRPVFRYNSVGDSRFIPNVWRAFVVTWATPSQIGWVASWGRELLVAFIWRIEDCMLQDSCFGVCFSCPTESSPVPCSYFSSHPKWIPASLPKNFSIVGRRD